MEKDKKIKRRSFLNYLIGGGTIAFLGALFYPIYKYLKPPEIPEAVQSQGTVGTLAELKDTPKKFKIFKFGDQLGIIIDMPDGEVRAFSATCTHLDCTVQYRPSESVLWCACHNGKYDLTGRNISGPPPRPLQRWVVHHDVASDKLFVSKGEGA